MSVRTAFALLACLAASPLPAALPVTVGPLGDQLIEHEVRAPATVVAANEAVITAQVTAVVDEIAADVGASVGRGELLVSLEDVDQQLALDSARATLLALQARVDQARQRLARGEELKTRNYISDEELQDRRTALRVLEAEVAAQRLAVRSAEIALGRTRVTAPYAATVTARNAQVGSLAQPGTPLLTLVQTGNREVDADVDPRYADGLSSALAPRFVSRGRQWPLVLARLSDVIDRESRIRKARFRFEGDGAPAGTSGEVLWQDAAGLVPVPLIVQRGGRLGLFSVENGRAVFLPLPGAQEGRPAPHALPRDTVVVINGQSRLQEGDELQIAQQ